MGPNCMIGDLFDPTPLRWGLRGDPLLWDQLRTDTGNVPLSPSFRQCLQIINVRFRHHTGYELSEVPEGLHIPQFATGGMSSGMIDPRFWARSAARRWAERHLGLVAS